MKILAYTLVIIGFLNFLIFFIIAVSIGGDAVNGKIEGDKYYLGEHGRFTEVSPSVFGYSKFHVYSVFVTHPLAMVAAYLLVTKKRGKLNGPGEANFQT